MSVCNAWVTALTAARAGATYVSPFIGRLDDIGLDGMQLISDIADIFLIHDIDTEIIAASIRNEGHVHGAALAGANIATIPYAVIKKVMNSLQDLKENRYNLITSLKSSPEE